MKKPLSHVASFSAVVAIVLLALRGTAFATLPPIAPEIDPGTAVSGLALLAGGALLLIERLRRR